MVTKELKALIKESIREVLQEEKLNFHNSLISHKSNIETETWNQFSLQQAMKGLENDNLPEYTEADLVEKWQ